MGTNQKGKGEACKLPHSALFGNLDSAPTACLSFSLASQCSRCIRMRMCRHLFLRKSRSRDVTFSLNSKE